jgi:hypothetical protein
MKIFLTYLFLLFSVPLFAQSVQSFDIVSFSLASTWKKEAQQDWLAISGRKPRKKNVRSDSYLSKFTLIWES